MIGTQTRGARIGVDVLDVNELHRLIDRSWFLRYTFAPEEMKIAEGMGAERRLEFLAGRFAAKEAVIKLLGLGMFQGVRPCEICVDRSPNGSPMLLLRGIVADLHRPPIALSIAHKGNVVVAIAISSPPGSGPADKPNRRKEIDSMPESTGEPASAHTASLRIRIGQEDAHYGGGLVAGARILQIFGDLVTEITIQADGDEGLLSEYSSVRFTAPIRPGDYIEATARLVHKTRLRRVVELEARKVIAAQAGTGTSGAIVLAESLQVCTATATTVIPARKPIAAKEA